MEDIAMSTVTIGVSSTDTVFDRAKAAFQGVPQGEYISFETVEDLWKTLTPRRWALIGAMAGKGAMSTRAAGRLIGQDIKTVHADVHALLNAGILEKDAKGRIRFPYDAIHVDFLIQAA
jgi:predicted transcriptional regulator